MKPLIHTPPSEFSNRNHEEAFVRLARMGDMDAFNQLVLANQDLAYHHAYALSGDPDFAEDAAQESFIKAFQHLDQYRGGSFRFWLLTIVTNTVYDLLRRSCRRPTQALFPENEHGDDVDSAAWLTDPTACVEAAVEQREFAKRVYDTLDSLPAVFRSVITLIDLYELDYREAAEVLRVPLGTIKSRLARARQQMQKKLTVGENLPANFRPIHEYPLRLEVE